MKPNSSSAVDALKCTQYSWNEVARMMDKLADKVRSSGFIPDIIVALARGGLVPARVMADKLNVKEMAVMRVSHWDSAGARNTEALITQPIAIDVKGKKLLVVDDLTDTGKSQIAAVEDLKKRGAGEIRTAVLHHKAASKFTPNYYAEFQRGYSWIIYPWEYNETILQLAEKLKGKSLKQIRTDLKSKFNVEITEKELKGIIEK